MRKFACAAIASTFLTTTMAMLPAVAYTQADADACTPDAFRLCQNAIPNANLVAQCLAEKKRQLSPACATVFSRPRDASRDRSNAVQKTKF